MSCLLSANAAVPSRLKQTMHFQVVNIKELSDPQIINPLTAPKKFEAK